MCGRVIVDHDENMAVASCSELVAWMHERPAGYEPSWNIKPTQPIPAAFTDRKDGTRRLEYAYWSLVPIWSKTLNTKFPAFNARSETADEKASVKNRRCVIPVTGFYEWTGPKSSRTPHAFFDPEPIIPMAGLYSWRHEPDAGDDEGWHLTATILPRASAGVMEPIHDRMPVFLSDELMSEWLDPDTIGNQLLLDAVSEASLPLSERLHDYQVATLKGDGPELILPLDR